jgi:hypothetical protein
MDRLLKRWFQAKKKSPTMFAGLKTKSFGLNL